MEGVTATNGKEKVMFEHKTEEEARKEILSMVEGYYQAFHAKKEDFREGDRISYAARVYDQDEMYNLVDSALEFWLTSDIGLRRHAALDFHFAVDDHCGLSVRQSS